MPLADTLEPLKCFQNSADALDKIYIDSSQKGQRISIQVIASEVWEKCYKDTFDDGSINTWMDVEIFPLFMVWNVPRDGAAIRPITKGLSSYIHALPALI